MSSPPSEPLPGTEPPGTARLVLRDGTTAGVRLANAGDREAMRAFFAALSPLSLRRRFLGSTRVDQGLIERLSDAADPRRAATLVVCRLGPAGTHFIGVGSYFAVPAAPASAEVAFAVAEGLHGKGIGTALLEGLVPLAIDNGFTSFEASVLPENFEMLDVFRHSGFEVESATEEGSVEVRLRLASSPTSTSAADERDRIATVASLRPLLEPRAVAVIGVSRNTSSLGRRLFDALRASTAARQEAGMAGPLVYAVNPAVDAVDGMPCHRSARELPAGVDLAVIVVPRDAVPGVVDDCAAAGVRAIVVISAGFAEVGAEGRALQHRLVEKVRGYGMRMMGPNCMGVFNTREPFRFNATFSERMPPAGRIALASQSGGLGLAILELASNRLIGLSYFVSLGNKADVSGNDLLQYAESDPHTSVILLYLESMGNPRRFARLARRIARKKPIVVVKSGRTPSGVRAAASHTAGLAASEVAVDALFRQAGVIRAESIDAMFDIAACLNAQPLPAGRRVAILTNAGGPGILAADACAGAALDVVELSPATRSALGEILPASAAAANPIDMIASAGPDQYQRSVETLLAAGEVDSLLVVYTPIERRRSKEILTAIQEGVRAGRRIGGKGKPVLVVTMASAQGIELNESGETLPVYAFPEQAARALGEAANHAAWRAAPAGTAPAYAEIDVRAARAFVQDIVRRRGDTWLDLEELRHLLGAFGLTAVPGSLARTAEEAVALARSAAAPVALKIVSPRILHKTEAGGVRLDLRTDEAVRDAFEQIARAGGGEPVLVQPMASGVETFVGLTEDPQFGPLVGFGLGGTAVEVFRDVVFRIAPLSDRDADDMLHGIRGVPLLEGHRGRPGADLPALRDLLLRVSYLGDQVPELLELDLNPVMAGPPGDGCEIVDARARVGPPSTVGSLPGASRGR